MQLKCGVRICACVLSALVLFSSSALAASPENSAVSAVLVDCNSGRTLYEKNPNEKRLIASITKLMTALVAVESHSNLSQEVKVKKEWTQAEGSSLYLKEGETLSLETLLYGLLLHSGNDAALAIAGFCAGDVDTFVEWMNQRASDLGMKHTHFQNPNGLNHDEHYSTAADMAKLAMACMKNETIAKIVATKSISIEGRTFTNHNKLLWQYEGCVGMKTGYTQMAGRTLISSAKRNGQTLIVVTLCDPNDWADHKKLLDYGFETYPQHTFFQKGEELTHLPVEGSLLHSVPVYVNEDVSYPLSENETGNVSILLPDKVKAPIKKGSIAGQVTVTLEGKMIGESYLRYGASIERNAVAANQGIRRMLELFHSKQTGFITEKLLED
jgi:D-alanyl-D-alanine carboxypeptidase